MSSRSMLALGLAGGAASAFLMARHLRGSSRAEAIAAIAARNRGSRGRRREDAAPALAAPPEAEESYEAFEAPYEAFDDVRVDDVRVDDVRVDATDAAEEYEPVAAEDLGREWLTRATEAPKALDSRVAVAPLTGVAPAAEGDEPVDSAERAEPDSEAAFDSDLLSEDLLSEDLLSEDRLSELWDASPPSDDDPTEPRR